MVVDLASDVALARDLAAGGVFVPGCDVGLDEECELIVRAGNDELVLAGHIVWVDERGAGIQILGCDPELKQRLQALADAAADGAVSLPRTASVERGAEATARAVAEHADGDWSEEWGVDDSAGDGDAAPIDEAEPPPDGEVAAVDEAAADGQPPPFDEAVAAGTDAPRRKPGLNAQQRLRNLTLAQQVKLAHSGEMTVRIALERMYHKDVWEPLLRNPRITGPEVARIARMGSLPRVLLEIIVNNGAWVQVPEVRRALLQNPRLGVDQILRILRLLPKHELKLAAMQTAYPHAVRDAARKMIRDD